MVKQYSVSGEGQELTLQLYKPGSYFYMAWLGGVAESHYYFETMTRVELIKAPLVSLSTFLDDHPEVLREVNARVFRGIDQVLFRFETLAFGDAATKVAAALLLLMRRFGAPSPVGRAIALPLTHREIALLCALTRETVSVEMSGLKKRGVIARINGQVVIRDEPYLRSLIPYQVER